MIALALLLYALLLTQVVAPLMVRVRFFDRAPNLGIFAWQILAVSTLLSLTLGGLVLTVPTVPFSTGIAEFVEACVMIIRQRYASPGGVLLAGGGLALALTLLARALYCLARATATTRQQRRVHLQKLTLVGRGGPAGLTVLDHDAPAVYCLPGRGRRIVATRGALTALTPQQLDAVLAHECAHLRGRHHLVLTTSAALAEVLPIRALTDAHAEIARLVELAADDAAVRRTGRYDLAEALLTLAESRSPATALAASSTHGAARVRRLITHDTRLGLLPVILGTGMVVLALLLPLTVAAGPALAAAGANYCPTGPMTWESPLLALLC